MDIQDKIILIKGINQTQNIKSLEYTPDGKIEITYNTSEQIYRFSPNKVQIIENSIDANIEKMLDYLRDIVQHQKNEEIRDFLISTFSCMYINEESLLYKYLTQKQIETRNRSHNYIFPFRFNLSQKEALESALANSISVINGPPGTGKTQTILNIVSNLVIAGKSVAVVSNNNEAVKNVQEKLKDGGYASLTAMLGNSENQKCFFDNLPIMDTEKLNCSESFKELESRITDLNNRLNSLMESERQKVILAEELYEWDLEKDHFEKYFEKQQLDKIKQLPLLFKNPDKIILFLAETSIAKENKGLRKAVSNLVLILKYWLFGYENLRKLDIDTVLCLQHEFYIRQIELLQSNIAKLDEHLRKYSFNEMLKEHQLYSEKLFKKHLFLQYKNIEKVDFTIQNFKERFSEFKKRYPILLSTTFSLRKSIPDSELIDYVIIDEASQVDLCAGALALSCCRNAIIVGDMKQLSQIIDQTIQNECIAEPLNEKYDYFKHSILSSILEVYGEKVPQTTLREHYRCHPQIIEFCNKKYYNGELIPYTRQDMSDNPLILYRTVEGNHMRTVTRGENNGSYNQRELDVVIEEVLKNPDIERDTIGFVTPYRKQANKAAEQLATGIECDTVHKYQGREKDMMIMSTVLDQKNGYQYRMKFIDDSHMINVAVSRAIKQFVLVTDRDLFFNEGENIRDLIRYMMYNTLDQNIIESNVISVFDLLYKKYSNKLSDIKKRMNSNARYPSEEALRVLLEDILSSPQYAVKYTYTCQVLLRNLLNSLNLLTEEERAFVNHRSSLDFVILRKMDKSCAMVIEVDGFTSHENAPEQLHRDKLKDSILKKYNIPFLRLPTNGSREKQQIESMLEKCD